VVEDLHEPLDLPELGPCRRLDAAVTIGDAGEVEERRLLVEQARLGPVVGSVDGGRRRTVADQQRPPLARVRQLQVGVERAHVGAGEAGLEQLGESGTGGVRLEVGDVRRRAVERGELDAPPRLELDGADRHPSCRGDRSGSRTGQPRLDEPLPERIEHRRDRVVHERAGYDGHAAGPDAVGSAPDTPRVVVGVEQFRFRWTPTYRMLAAPFLVSPRSAWVRVADDELLIRFGRWSVCTTIANVVGTEITSGYSLLKTAGPPHLSLADRGITFATNPDRGLCVRFGTPVPGISAPGRRAFEVVGDGAVVTEHHEPVEAAQEPAVVGDGDDRALELGRGRPPAPRPRRGRGCRSARRAAAACARQLQQQDLEPCLLAARQRLERLVAQPCSS
jgi:hypothetical protein